jgi:hypothetical protein
MQTFDSSKIVWSILTPCKHDKWTSVYCADGDGIVQVMVYDSKIKLVDQGDCVKTWAAKTEISKVLEDAQDYIFKNYPEIYEDAMHWNDSSEEDEQSMFNHLNNIK